jgi:hypothetical protein
MKDVTCALVRDAFRAGRLPVDAAVLAHVRECPRCTELFADDARLGRALGSTHPAPLAGPDLLRGLRLRLDA